MVVVLVLILSWVQHSSDLLRGMLQSVVLVPLEVQTQPTSVDEDATFLSSLVHVCVQRSDDVPSLKTLSESEHFHLLGMVHDSSDL